MEILYSPWRLPYVTGATPPGPGCVFCSAIERGASARTLVMHTDPLASIILNRYPYNNGHLMVVPRVHTDSLTGLPEDVLRRCLRILVVCETALRQAYACHGINMGLNLGEAAGAGITDHIHWHALPRWRGDTNFMTVLGGTRVVPEDLDTAYKRLRPLFETMLAVPNL